MYVCMYIMGDFFTNSSGHPTVPDEMVLGLLFDNDLFEFVELLAIMS
jgi:hypothetical protein